MPDSWKEILLPEPYEGRPLRASIVEPPKGRDMADRRPISAWVWVVEWGDAQVGYFNWAEDATDKRITEQMIHVVADYRRRLPSA
jgi:hypothetical protein